MNVIYLYDPKTKCLRVKKEENTFFYEQSSEKIVIFCKENENHTIFGSNKVTFYQNDKKIDLKDLEKDNILLSIQIFTKNESILSDESILSYYFNFLINSSIYLKKNIKTFIKKVKDIEIIMDDNNFNLELDNNFYNNIAKNAGINYIYSEKYYENIFTLAKLLYIRDMLCYKRQIKKEVTELKLQIL